MYSLLRHKTSFSYFTSALDKEQQNKFRLWHEYVLLFINNIGVKNSKCNAYRPCLVFSGFKQTILLHGISVYKEDQVYIKIVNRPITDPV